MRTSASRPITRRCTGLAARSPILVNGASSPGRRRSACSGALLERAPKGASRQAAPDRARDRDRAKTEQGRNPRALSEPRAYGATSRRARRLACLFRQGAAPPDAGRGGALVALPQSPSSAAQTAPSMLRAMPRPGARSRRRAVRALDEVARSRAVPDGRKPIRYWPHALRGGRGRTDRSIHRLTIDATLQKPRELPRARRALGPHLGRDPGGRSRHRRVQAGRLGGLFRCRRAGQVT